MKAQLFRTALVLGLVSAVGPFAIDAYLPALPAIGQALFASSGAVQMTLTAFFVSLGFGQLVYGPAADMFGRKAPLYVGLLVFIIASVACALATSVQTLILFRFIQGAGACAGMVIPRAIVRDLHTGVDATRLMSMLMLVFSISPILAPLAGSMIVAWAGWRGVFWFVLAAALVSLVLLATRLKETREHHERAGSSVRAAIRSYLTLLKDRRFMGLTLTGSFGVASFFSYLANSSFLVIEHYHHSPQTFAILFGINAFAFIGSSQSAALLITRFGMNRVVKVAECGYCASMVCLWLLFMSGIDSLAVLITFLFVGFGFLGLVIPTTTVMALEEQGHVAGTASALLGTMQFGVGALVMAIVAPFGNATAVPMITGIAAVALISLLLAFATLRRPTQTRLEPPS